MTARQQAMEDMKASGLNISLFLYDRCFDGRVLNGKHSNDLAGSSVG
jgi:hypothetical protein